MVDARSGGSLIMAADIERSPSANGPLAMPPGPTGTPWPVLKGSPLLTKGPLCSACCAPFALLIGAALQDADDNCISPLHDLPRQPTAD
jgi:hypothetical protein